MNLVFHWTILSALVLPASPPNRTDDAQTAPAHPSPPSAEHTNSPTTEHTPPTAEDVLRALQHSQPTIEIIKPVHGDSADTVSTRQKLLPEGSALVDKIGRLEHDPSGYAFIFDDAGKSRRLRLLPNATLEVMARTDRHAATPITFVVSGELTVFHDENYLLPRLAMRASSPPSNTKVSGPTASMDHPSVPAAELPAPPAPSRTVRSVEDVAAALSAAKPTKLADDPEENDMIRDLDAGSSPHLGRPAFARGPGRTAAFAHTIQVDGTMLINRPGRLIEQGTRWMFAPESDHRDFPEPPLYLLPSRNTEMMIRRRETEKLGVVFLVSGEITLFDGENYLLPRVATRQLVSDNLRK